MPRTGGHIEYEPRHGAASAIGKMIEFKLERSGNVRCWVLDASGQREGKRISFFMKVNKGDAEAQVEQHFISLCAKGVFEAAPQPGPPPPRSPGEEPHSSSSARVDPDGAEAMDDGDSPGTGLTSRADYAAQIETLRTKHATCTVKERHNRCVLVAGFGTYEETVEVPKKKGRAASTKIVRKQRVFVFYGFHAAGYRPDARSYNVLREDVTTFLKTGKFAHGEWFWNGERQPGGDHSQPLPDGIGEAAWATAIFPTIEHETDVVDGCAAQFAGKNNYYQIAVWRTKMGSYRDQCTLTPMMGKSICDALSNPIAGAIKGAIKNSTVAPNPGTHQLVHFFALNKQTPLVEKAKKSGWWAVERVYYGFYNSKLFTASRVPTAKGFKGSKPMHSLVGLCTEDEKARRDGPLRARHVFCGCARCAAFDYENCLMKDEFGTLKPFETPLETQVSAAVTRSVALEDFADACKAQRDVGVRVTKVDQAHYAHLAMLNQSMDDGPLWFARLLEDAKQLGAPLTYRGHRFDTGFWVAKAQWFTRINRSPNTYKLLPGDFMLDINHGIRIDAPAFKEKGRGRGCAYELTDPEYHRFERAA